MLIKTCLLLSISSGEALAQVVGTWSPAQSDLGFADSDAFDVVRAIIAKKATGATYLELSVLSDFELAGADVVVLDSGLKRALAESEIGALRRWTAAGGTALLHVSGPVGALLADGFGVDWVEEYGGEEWVEHPLAAYRSDGPFGSQPSFVNRYASHLAPRSGAARVLAADAVGPVLIELQVGEGSVVMYTNAFAFADPDWSVGGAGDANAVLLLNLLFGDHPSAHPHSSAAQRWARAAQEALDSGDVQPLRTFVEVNGGDATAGPWIERARTWLDRGTAGPDPRFFPVSDFAIGATTRRDLKRAGHASTEHSKWNFDLGEIEAVCLEGQVDVCMTARVGGPQLAYPEEWRAAGIEAHLGPEALQARLGALGYRCSSSFSAVSPFGTQIVGEGYGLRWEFDFERTGLSADNAQVGVTVRAE